MTQNSRRKGDSALLVSFCNVKDGSKPVVALVDLKQDKPEVRWIGAKNDARLRGVTGLCYWKDLVCVTHQGAPRKPLGFVLLDPASDFEQISEGEFQLDQPIDPHSVCSRDDELYFVLSGKDSVYKATFDNKTHEWDVSLYWTFPGSSGTADENHLNAIECIGGELCVSGLGKKEPGTLWASTERGFVYNIEQDKHVMRDLHHPHSLLQGSQAIWTCESLKSRLTSNNGERYELPIGYVRGLAISNDAIYVGVSKKRKGSKSTGNLKAYEGVCRIYKISRESRDVQMLIDISDTRNEIYEMILI